MVLLFARFLIFFIKEAKMVELFWHIYEIGLFIFSIILAFFILVGPVVLVVYVWCKIFSSPELPTKEQLEKIQEDPDWYLKP